MCGIAGYFRKDQRADAGLIRQMCDRIRHRGPDDEGFHLDGGCAIGMRRLSIIDLSTGHQPIANEDETVWIVFNGEIYNYLELRDELIRKGHRFRTNSDTETLIHLYEEEGPEGIAKLRGMFGYAIWDSRRRRLMLARDRFGKKPLYFSATPQGFYFASELKCLGGLPIPYDLDREALQSFFLFGYLQEPETPYKGIRKLPPGSWLLYDTDTGRVQQQPYWRPPVPVEQPPADLSYEQAVTQLRDLFDESVRIRMMADVPLGAFLSGGLDSSSVVASMALQSKEPVNTFSIGFEENEYNELPYARMVAEQYKTRHHEIVVRPDSIELTNRLVRSFDEPFGDSSAIPTFIVSEFAVQHVKVALSGDGGDELFGGYESFWLVDKFRQLDRIPSWMRNIAGAFASRLPYSARGANFLYMLTRPSAFERYMELNYSPTLLRRNLLTEEWMIPGNTLQQRFARFLPQTAVDPVAQSMYFEVTAKLPSDMLVKVDRMSMAASLEVRSPMLDHKLAEFAGCLPHAWKMRNNKGKLILRDALGKRLPPALLTQPKRGFGVPMASWFRKELRPMVRDTLTSKTFADRGIAKPEFVRYMLQEHDTGRRDNSYWLWHLLMLEMWFRESNLAVQRAPSLAMR